MKKSIVDPKHVHDSDTNRSDNEDRGANNKKSKEKKGLKMPAGLALMHGFSATNIGKHRLTVCLRWQSCFLVVLRVPSLVWTRGGRIQQGEGLCEDRGEEDQGDW